MAENEEKLKSFLMKMKEKSEKAINYVFSKKKKKKTQSSKN